MIQNGGIAKWRQDDVMRIIKKTSGSIKTFY